MANNVIERAVNIDLSSTPSATNIIGKAIPMSKNSYTACAVQLIIEDSDPGTRGKFSFTGSNDGNNFAPVNNGFVSIPYYVELAGSETSVFLYLGVGDGAQSIQYINIDLSGGVGPGVVKKAIFSFTQ